MLKKINWFIKLGVLFILIAIVIMVIGIIRLQSEKDSINKLPVISDENMLREVINDRPHKYLITNAPLTGEVCDDELGILSDEYVYIEYSIYYYTFRPRANDSMIYDTNWDWDDTHISAGKDLYIYGNIPLEADSYNMYCYYVDLTDRVKPEYADKLHTDNSVSYYYPKEIGDIKDNKRYALRGVLQGQKTSFIATVGNGKTVLSSLYNSSDLPISAENDMSSIEYSQDKTVGTLGLIDLVLVILGILMIIFGILDVISNALEKKKKTK